MPQCSREKMAPTSRPDWKTSLVCRIVQLTPSNFTCTNINSSSTSGQKGPAIFRRQCIANSGQTDLHHIWAQPCNHDSRKKFKYTFINQELKLPSPPTQCTLPMHSSRSTAARSDLVDFFIQKWQKRYIDVEAAESTKQSSQLNKVIKAPHDYSSSLEKYACVWDREKAALVEMPG